MDNTEMMALEAMKLCERRGDFSTMRTHLNASGQSVIDSVDHDTLKAFAELLMRVIKANDYEVLHGRGSLMDWNNPFNQEMLEKGAFRSRYPDKKIDAIIHDSACGRA